MSYNYADSSFRSRYIDAVTVMLASSANVRSDEDVVAAAASVCPRWRCPCVASQHHALLFASKRHDSTSHFRRTTLSAAREALLLTQNVLRRIVSHATHVLLTSPFICVSLTLMY